MTNNQQPAQKFSPVENTPFYLVTDEQGTHITMGNYLVTDKVFDTEEEADEYIMLNEWALLIPVIGIIAEKVFEDKYSLTKDENKK